MATTPAKGGVIPGVISVPATPAKGYQPKPNGVAMPTGVINPFVSAPPKGGKK